MYSSDNIGQRQVGTMERAAPSVAPGVSRGVVHGRLPPPPNGRGQGPLRIGTEVPDDKSAPGRGLPALERLRALVGNAVRRTAPDSFERRNAEDGPLTGSPADFRNDPGQTGRFIQPARNDPTGIGPGGHQSTVFFDAAPDIVPTFGGDGGNTSPDILDHVQSLDSAPAEALRAARVAFPGLRVVPAPVCRSIVLTAKDTPVEIEIPSGAVLMRVTWSGMAAGVDLHCSMTSRPLTTLAVGNNQSPDAMAGIIVNPDPGAYYYVKSKQNISVMVPAASLAFAATTVVNIQCIMQY